MRPRKTQGQEQNLLYLFFVLGSVFHNLLFWFFFKFSHQRQLQLKRQISISCLPLSPTVQWPTEGHATHGLCFPSSRVYQPFISFQTYHFDPEQVSSYCICCKISSLCLSAPFSVSPSDSYKESRATQV